MKRLFATILLIAFITLYSLIAMTIAAAKLPGTPGWVQLIYYAVAGLIWVLPAGVIISWGWKEKKQPESAQ